MQSAEAREMCLLGHIRRNQNHPQFHLEKSVVTRSGDVSVATLLNYKKFIKNERPNSILALPHS